MRTGRAYRSKVDLVLVVPVAVALLLPPVMGGWLLLQQQPGGVLLVGFGTVVGLFVWMFSWPMRYELGETHLQVRSGQLSWEVPLARITRVAPSRSLWSSPAWSLDRVRIDYGGDFILVSPDDRESFIEDVAVRCPHLARRGPGLETPPPSP